LIEIIKAYANGELPRGASQAAVWHINSEVSWEVLASKLTGTVRHINRSPYFSHNEVRAAMAIVQRAKTMTANKTVNPRNWKSQSQKAAELKAKEEAKAKEHPSKGRYDGKKGDGKKEDGKKGKADDADAEVAEGQES